MNSRMIIDKDDNIFIVLQNGGEINISLKDNKFKIRRNIFGNNSIANIMEFDRDQKEIKIIKFEDFRTENDE
jgi:hypothetical protein